MAIVFAASKTWLVRQCGAGEAGAGKELSIEVINGAGSVERCEGGAAFVSIIEQLSSIGARRALGREEASCETPRRRNCPNFSAATARQ